MIETISRLLAENARLQLQLELRNTPAPAKEATDAEMDELYSDRCGHTAPRYTPADGEAADAEMDALYKDR